MTGWKKGADRKDIPEPERVWRADLDFAPRSVWSVSPDGQITRLPLARTPNWKVSNPDDVKSEWWVWDNLDKHLHITGLTFRFTTPNWAITSATWDFRTKPWGLRPSAHPGCVRVWGEGRDIRIANCRFEHVFFPIRIRSLLAGQRVDDVRIEDNDFPPGKRPSMPRK